MSSDNVNVDKAYDYIKSLTLLEAADLAKKLEDTFGISAAMMAATPPAASGSESAEKVEEKTEFNVILESIGGNKIAVIKAVRTILALKLQEAKELVESAPKLIKSAAKKEEVDKIKAELEKAGASVKVE
jgi:large subunit ribosomal protein L7/L12